MTVIENLIPLLGELGVTIPGFLQTVLSYQLGLILVVFMAGVGFSVLRWSRRQLWALTLGESAAPKKTHSLEFLRRCREGLTKLLRSPK